MLGAITGDVAGSRFEWVNIKSKDFQLFSKRCRPTDDSVMTVAICKALLECSRDYHDLGEKAAFYMREYGRMFPHAGYGGTFRNWLSGEIEGSYGSFGNGAAMRVSGCGYAANSLEEAIALSKAVTEVTHDHPEGLKGAEAVTVAIYMARCGRSMDEIREHICTTYYDIDFTLDRIRPTYVFDVTCQGSVPQALEAFFESVSYEDCIRNAISIGGDSDTIAAMAGSIAEAYYGMPREIRETVKDYLDTPLLSVVREFEKKYPPKII